MALIPIVAPEEFDNPPTVSFDLGPSQSKVLKGMKPGDTVRLVVTGKLVHLSMNEPMDDTKKGFLGHASLEGRRMEVSKANEDMEALLEGD